MSPTFGVPNDARDRGRHRAVRADGERHRFLRLLRVGEIDFEQPFLSGVVDADIGRDSDDLERADVFADGSPPGQKRRAIVSLTITRGRPAP